jgi:hypothetical protein
MAHKGGCNYEFESAKSAQGEKRVTPSTFSRNNMSKGGVNKHAGGSDKWDGSPAQAAGTNGVGKYRHDKK